MEVVEAQSKKYELISVRSDPMYDQWKSSIDEVKKFIIEKNLIVYGGTAIDFALRLKGDCIYPDDSLAVPDLDVYSFDAVNHAYELADRLFALGHTDVRAIRGVYVSIMKIDIGGKHIAADISYVPKRVFDHIPHIEYEGMRIVHPNFQRIDTHSSLAFPFDDSPREVIFNRWPKDITRYNKLWAAYPVSAVPINAKLREISIDVEYANWVFHGFAAYALLYTALAELVSKSKSKNSTSLDGIIPHTFKVLDGKIHLSTPGGNIDFLHFEPTNILYAHKLNSVKHYAAIMGSVPKRTVCENSTENNIRLTVYLTAHRLVCITPVQVGTTRFKCSSVQYLMYYLMSSAYFTEFIDGVTGSEATRMRDVYLSYYASTIRMIEVAEQAYAGKTDDMSDDDLNKAAFMPNTYVYGNNNENESTRINVANLKADIGLETDRPVLPINYYPGRGNTKQAFDYEQSKYFIKDGRELPK